jgi:GH25 family lysozyme M1 (1,4-beta-N-acetylmuramidase)
LALVTFPDIAEHQRGQNAQWFAQWPAVILRAGTGERTFSKDQQFDSHYRHATEAGVLIGSYWYADPGRTSPEQQADEMVNHVAGRPLALGYWLDLEEGHGDLVGWTHRFMSQLTRRGVKLGGIYTGASFLRTALGAHPSLKAYNLWIAAYGPNNGGLHPINPSPPWTPQIHQFTSRGGPGGSGLDLNVADSAFLAQIGEQDDMFSDADREVVYKTYKMLAQPGDKGVPRSLLLDIQGQVDEVEPHVKLLAAAVKTLAERVEELTEKVNSGGTGSGPSAEAIADELAKRLQA